MRMDIRILDVLSCIKIRFKTGNLAYSQSVLSEFAFSINIDKKMLTRWKCLKKFLKLSYEANKITISYILLFVTDILVSCVHTSMYPCDYMYTT